MANENVTRDRITRVRIQGLRTLDDIMLDLNGLTVLIGDNGSGKSSIIEALEIIRKASNEQDFIQQIMEVHGGPDLLFRKDASRLRLSVRVEGEGSILDYSLAIERRRVGAVIVEESLDEMVDGEVAPARHVLRRDATSPLPLINDAPITFSPISPRTLLAALGDASLPAVQRVRKALDGVQVHVPFDVTAPWLLSNRQRLPSPLREAATVHGVRSLGLYGKDFVNCFFELSQRGGSAWQRTLEKARSGLGLDLSDIKTPAAGRGKIELVVRFGALEVPASALSDGQLAYLAFVALSELGEERSLLAFDEPETCLHPGLLVRVVWLLEELAESCPIILATHSDRLLDALENPATSAVLCELDERRATRLLRPDRAILDQWLADYRGLGELRGAGFDHHVFAVPVAHGVP